ncbi:periplasmic heavy metal sensor [Kaistia algarum]|uniref:periplasmic heavy metal sensor n=1 Tax=Kaistia algarum TaxID=2083279 RepID=UPI0014041F3A|nr:periplasmic heavy metal sensor [Kaistia algarum]MCX5513236.1 periplasmic heavy metal sensor [Kaistia algarum]
MTLTGRWAALVLTALGLSLCANFVWLGFQVSRSVGPGPQPPSAERLISLGGAALPKPLRAEIAAALAPRRDDLKTAFRQMRDARLAVLQAMRADPLDPADLEAAFADLRRRLDEVAAIGEAAVVQGLQHVSPEIRSQIEASGKPKATVRKDN